jgi:hypothetical protein
MTADPGTSRRKLPSRKQHIQFVTASLEEGDPVTVLEKKLQEHLDKGAKLHGRPVVLESAIFQDDDQKRQVVARITQAVLHPSTGS